MGSNNYKALHCPVCAFLQSQSDIKSILEFERNISQEKRIEPWVTGREAQTLPLSYAPPAPITLKNFSEFIDAGHKNEVERRRLEMSIEPIQNLLATNAHFTAFPFIKFDDNSIGDR